MDGDPDWIGFGDDQAGKVLQAGNADFLVVEDLKLVLAGGRWGDVSADIEDVGAVAMFAKR